MLIDSIDLIIEIVWGWRSQCEVGKTTNESGIRDEFSDIEMLAPWKHEQFASWKCLQDLIIKRSNTQCKP